MKLASFVAKGRSRFGTTTDEIVDPHVLALMARLNCRVLQQATTRDLIWSLDYLISYCSQSTMLRPGDIISTGKPGGVGHKRTPPVFMKAGDVIEVEISSIGVLRNIVTDENAEVGHDLTSAS